MFCLATGSGLLVAARTPRAHALDLTGVLIYGIDANGDPAGPVWHTSSDPWARPLGFTRWVPAGVRGIPFANGADGEITIPLLPGSQISTLFWQYAPSEFPQRMVLNLFFNGDSLTPGISAVVPFGRGFTLFGANAQATTLSLYGREIENSVGLSFGDAQWSARLGALFYMPASGGDDWLWRPSDFTNIDRVGSDGLTPDGRPDGIMVFELVIGPSAPSPAVPAGPGPQNQGAGGIAGPLVAVVGGDQWVAPPTSALSLTPATALPTQFGITATTPTLLAAEAEDTPTPAATRQPEEPSAAATREAEGVDTTSTPESRSIPRPQTTTPATRTFTANVAPARTRPARTAGVASPTAGETTPTPKKGWLW